MEISRIEISFLQSILHSILLPRKVSFELSDNGCDFMHAGTETYQTHPDVPDYQKKQFKVSFPEKNARYIRVRAKNVSELPDWHIRAGQETFIFADEIIVR